MKIDNISTSVIKVQDARIARPVENLDRTEMIKQDNDEDRVVKKREEDIKDDVLEKSVRQANKALKQHDRMIQRTIHETTHTIMYVLKDTVTNEVIREFPPKKIQDMIAKMWEMAGILVDERR